MNKIQRNIELHLLASEHSLGKETAFFQGKLFAFFVFSRREEFGVDLLCIHKIEFPVCRDEEVGQYALFEYFFHCNG